MSWKTCHKTPSSKNFSSALLEENSIQPAREVQIIFSACGALFGFFIILYLSFGKNMHHSCADRKDVGLVSMVMKLLTFIIIHIMPEKLEEQTRRLIFMSVLDA